MFIVTIPILIFGDYLLTAFYELGPLRCLGDKDTVLLPRSYLFTPQMFM